jgi:hypothetical protein
VGDPETLLIDSTLLEVLHPRQVPQSAGFDGAASWVRSGVPSASMGLSCTSCAPPMASPSPTNSPPSERRRGLFERGTRCPGGSGRRSGEEALGRAGLPKRGSEGGPERGWHPLGATERSDRPHGARQHIEIAISSPKRVFGLGETLATTLVGLATRIAAKIAAYTYAFLVNRRLDRPQGRIKELWA